MSIKKYLGKSYRLSKSENFDEYMKALGVGAVTRKMGNLVTPTVTLTEKEGIYTLSTVSPFKSTTITFQPDVPFEEETADGRKVKSKVHFEGSTMTHTQEGEKTTVIIREFGDGEMKATMSIGNVTSTRVYTKVA